MNRVLRVAWLATIAASAACASRWPAQRIEMAAGSVTGDSALDGSYRWATVDGKAAPVEFPANSGRRVVYGTLDLRGALSARAGSGGSYSMRFTEQPVNDTVRTTGTDGQFVLRGDTLVLSPSGQSQSLKYRYAWRPSGDLALTDDGNHVWVYTRR
jgi:hypothetical protein